MVNKTNKLTVNTTYNVTLSTVTSFGYINSHHQSVQKIKSFDTYLLYLVSDLKPYNEFTCKISIKKCSLK